MNEATRKALREQGGLLAEYAEGPLAGSAREPSPPTPPTPAGPPSPARLAASGPRVAGRAAEYELLLEMILEGSRLHYDHSGLDPDVALLLGDQLYALGLERLASIGDLEAVAELGDLISLVAQAHAASDPELADAVWNAGAVAIGWGGSEQHERAKALARAEDHTALSRLRELAGRGGS